MGSQPPRLRSRNWRRWRGVLLLAGCFLSCNSLFAQQGNVLLESSEQVFSVLAALSAADYESSGGTESARKAREQVRAYLAAKNVPSVAELRKFRAEHRPPGGSGSELAQYVSLALLVGPPPDFRFSVPESDLPPDAKAVKGLVPLLRNFYREADLVALWSRLETLNDAEAERYTEAVRRSVALSDAYLRFPGGAYLGRTYTIYLSLLGVPEQVQARIYGSNYYLVITSAKEPKIAEIRHQYLHFLLDPLAVKYAPEIHQKVGLRAKAREAPALPYDFKEDFPLLVTECLIKAVELRMDKRPKAEAEKSVGELTASGLILVPYFYAALTEYEKQEVSMNIFYKPMMLGIDPAEELKRLADLKFTPVAPPAEGPANSALSEEEKLLDQGENLIYEGKYIEARDAFKTVLEKVDPRSERALYGLAAVYTYLRKPGLAEEYFQKTLEEARDLRIVTWSHIYLARLYDQTGRREKALGEYRAASLTATGFPDALRAVQNGMQSPFGSKN